VSIVYNRYMKHLTLVQKQAVRNKAAGMFAQDKSNAEIARSLGVGRQTVSRWYQQWKQHGNEGLTLRTPGPKSRLTQEQWDQIVRDLLLGPKENGYDTQFWSLDRIADLIKTKTGVCYHKCHVWYLLGRIDWSCQKPQRRAKQRDEQAISDWKEHDWPRIKRGRKNKERL